MTKSKKEETEALGKTEEVTNEKTVEETPDKAKRKEVYKITCCNAINKSFAGVTFKNGVATTADAGTADWFSRKTGYKVEAAEQEQT